MTLEATRKTCENRFKEQWGDTTPIEYENVPFTPPVDSPYVALWVSSPSSQDRINLGSNPAMRARGFIQIDINVPKSKKYMGNTARNTLADKAVEIFQFQQVSGITFSKATFADNPGIKKKGWNCLYISIEYKADTLN